MKSVRNLALLLVALLVLPLAAQTPTDPVAWLKAEGNAVDATSFGNSGVVNGSVPYVAGKVGNAFSFNGNVANYVRIPNSASLQTAQMSVEYWVYFNSAHNAATVSKRNGSSDAWQVGITYSGGNFNLQFVGQAADWYSAPLASPVGVWTHVAATYDGSTVRGYINGVQVLTQTVALQLGTRTSDIYIGNYAGISLPLDAKLDELSIYNRALSAAEVLAIYQAGSAGKTPPAPTVSGVSPSSGSTLGGTSVTITGTNLTGATAVTFGGALASGITVVNSTTITATTPPRTAGSASVVVATPGGSNAANSLYTYVAPTPTVTGVSPSSGSTLGGTSVTITGTNFTGTPSVTFGGVAATGVTLINSTTITATTPPGTAGSASVIVTTGGVSNAANSLYTYVAPSPTVTGVSPSSGSTLGGTSVTITGTNFTGATAVTFGGNAASGVTVINSTTITATTPARPAGPASVVVTTPGGSNAANSLYSYVTPAPTVTGVSPSGGSTSGGTNVTITGTNFTGVPSVTFGGLSATGVTVVNSTTITATTPGRVAGAASVVVATLNGSSEANTLFTYVSPNVAPSFDLPGSMAAWTPQATNRNWRSITSSADGSKLAAVVIGGQIYTSTDSGVSWTPRESNRDWYSITSSADGSKLAAAVYNGQIYTSTDSGVSWTPRDSNRVWWSITSSADGSKLAAVAYGGRIYTSTDSGVSWTPRDSNRTWYSITSSADGSKLAAVVNGGRIYTSTDSGVSWTPQESSRRWWSIASSADGSKLAAVVQFVTGVPGCQIYTSTDSGVNWTPTETSRYWYSITSSADGSKLAAVVQTGQIYTSKDSGQSWTPRESNRGWSSITSSADGNKLAAVEAGGQIYTNPHYKLAAACSSPSTTVNFATNISPGPVTEAGQTVSFQVSNDNNSLFTTQPAISSNGTLTFTPGSSTGVATVTVSVVDSGGTAFGGVDASLPETFTISVVPAVTSVSPPAGARVGGTSVTITGIGFTGATNVTFNSLQATSFTVVNDTTITAITPAGVVGTASVDVTTASGRSLTNSLYTYGELPQVVGVSPNMGSALGGTSVTISGNDLTGASAVTFGGAASASFTVVNDTTITAITPPGVAGTASVAVTNPFGSNAAALFTYVAPNVAPSFSLPDSWTAWTPYESNRTWKTLASSADGTRLAAVIQGGQIFTSADSGVTWTARENNRNWGSIASSADGTRLAAVELGGRIYTSTDSGVTWTARASNASWSSIASSADGTKLAAVAAFGQISTSTDGGVTWTARENSRLWNGITSSADGMKLAAEVSGGQIYTSTDGGATWTARESVRNWGGITSSSDGSKLAAIVQNGQIHTSSDGGVTWTPRDSSRNWWSITSSADGGKLAAVVKNGQIYTSIDSGVTWTARESNRTWQTITTSTDGSKLVAAVAGGQIYTSSRLPYLVTVAANSGQSTTGSFATSISPGPVAETSQTVTFQATNNNNALFITQPAISSNGTLTFTPGNSGGTATITVIAIDNGGTAYGGVNTSTPQTFTITVLAPIETWRQTHFGSIANSGNGADGFDFDRDGLVNLLEYGLVLSPVTSSSAPSATVATYPEGKRLRMFLSRDPARYDVTLEVQAGDDLVGWTTIATSALGAPFSGPGYVVGDSASPGVKTVEIRDVINIASAPRRFLRVKVTH